jgi:myo-inositol-1-phosphate synthase
MKKIKVAIVGAGNCAKSLVEGVQYYTQNNNELFGLMKKDIGGYLPEHIEFVCAFDIDKRKIGKSLGEALKEKPNNAYNIVDKINCEALVYEAPIIDSYASLMENYPVDNRFLVDQKLRIKTDLNYYSSTCDIDSIIEFYKKKLSNILLENKVDVLINYLPVGSQLATEFWANIAIENKISFVNCIPVFIASNKEWEKKFYDNKTTIIGDDMRSQFGASILSQMLQELAFERGHKVKAHIQRNVGGNTDFLNMEDKSRLSSKKISKENVIKSQNEIRNISIDGSFLHAGPSEYIAYYGDNKVANFRLELEGFGGAPVILDAQLSVQDSPNSAGVVIDAIRYIKVANELGIYGALKGPSAFTQKTPPKQMMFVDALKECEALANRQYTDSTLRIN